MSDQHTSDQYQAPPAAAGEAAAAPPAAEETRFVTRNLLPVPYCTVEEFPEVLRFLTADMKLAHAALIEAAAYSLGMVVRSALGLSASEAQLLFLVTPSFSGAVALAAARVLLHAGADICPVSYAPARGGAANADGSASGSPWEAEFRRQCETLALLGRPPLERSAGELTATLEPEFPQAHAIVMGIVDPLPEPPPLLPGEQELIASLNEHPLPIHSVLIPLGLLEARMHTASRPLYSSSTLSLGVPLQVYRQEVQFLGRHYLGDISLPRSVLGPGYEAPLFADQPVIQIVEPPAPQ